MKRGSREREWLSAGSFEVDGQFSVGQHDGLVDAEGGGDERDDDAGEPRSEGHAGWDRRRESGTAKPDRRA